ARHRASSCDRARHRPRARAQRPRQGAPGCAQTPASALARSGRRGARRAVGGADAGADLRSRVNDLIFASAVDLAEAIRTRTHSSAEIIEACLRRIESSNPALNAIVQLRVDRARAEAREADRAVARGDVTGPLHGVPFTVKDVCESAGLVCAAGLPERASVVPERDATVVARLRAAGAILLGKTNCPPRG